jgi:trimeric autotransporter adhesin
MKYAFCVVISICMTHTIQGQNIAINSTGTAPHPAAILDISAGDKGLLIPRVFLDSIFDVTTISNVTTGLLVFNINPLIKDGFGSGFYYFDADLSPPQWKQLKTETLQASSLNAWSTTGNADIDTASHFIGTKNAAPLLFRVAGEKAALLDLDSSNSFFGLGAGISNRGGFNTLVGFESGRMNSTGRFNIAFGARALRGNASGNNNLALGDSALAAYTNSQNLAIGSRAIARGTGQFNLAIGFEAMRGAVTGAVAGNNNTAVGYRALTSYTSAAFNVALGHETLNLLISGQRNTAVGFQALSFIGIRNDNTAVGHKALALYNGVNPNTAIGSGALSKTSAANNAGGFNTAVGKDALLELTTGNSNIALGHQAAQNITTGSSNIAIGRYALNSASTRSGNLAIGDSALHTYNAADANLAIGHLSLKTATGGFNTAIGFESMSKVSTGSENTAIGYLSLSQLTTGRFNTTVGFEAGRDQLVAGRNTLIGAAAGRNITQTAQNTAIGAFALERQSFNQTTNTGNTAVGFEAMLNTNPTTVNNGRRNTAIGQQAMLSNETGYHNTAIGAATSVGVDLFNATAIGFEAAVNESNAMYFGNIGIEKIGGQVNWGATSDGRFKIDVQENVPGLEFIKGLRPVTYHFDLPKLHRHIHSETNDVQDFYKQQSGALYSGFIAQEVEALAKNLGYNFSGVVAPANENSTYSIRYAEFVVPLVKALQEQQQIISEQAKELERQGALLHKILILMEGHGINLITKE